MFRFPDLFSNFTVGFLHAMRTRRFEFNSKRPSGISVCVEF